MRALPTTLLLALLGLAAGSRLARAADSPPPYDASDLAIEEDGVQAPWELTYDEVPGTPGDALSDWVEGVAKAAGVDDADLVVEVRVLRNKEDGTGATLLMVSVDSDPHGLLDALKAQGKPLGYFVRAMGDPSRVFVLAAPAGAEKSLTAMQMTYSIDTLARLAVERMDAGSRVGAIEMAQAARKIDPKAAPPLVALGMAADAQGDHAEAIDAFHAAFGKDVSIPVRGKLALRGYAHYGLACLQKKEPAFDREGRDALEKAVALEGEADKDYPVFLLYYNLACAHSRLKETSDALQALKTALDDYGKQHGMEGKQGLREWVQRTVLPEKDFANLKDLDAFKGIIDHALGGRPPSTGLEGF